MCFYVADSCVESENARTYSTCTRTMYSSGTQPFFAKCHLLCHSKGSKCQLNNFEVSYIGVLIF